MSLPTVKRMTMERIIGREREIRLLNEYAQSVKPEFVAVYGRRRVGKTFLEDTIQLARPIYKYCGGTFHSKEGNDTRRDCQVHREECQRAVEQHREIQRVAIYAHKGRIPALPAAAAALSAAESASRGHHPHVHHHLRPAAQCLFRACRLLPHPRRPLPALEGARHPQLVIFPDFIGLFCVPHGEMDQMDQMDQMDHQKNRLVQAKRLKGLLAV